MLPKNELIAILEDMRYSAYYNIFSQQCLQQYFRYLNKTHTVPFELPGIELIDENTLKLDKFCLDLNRIHNKKLLEIKRSANTFITRNWLKEVFRTIQSYSEDMGFINEFKKESWYHFARLYVNAFSHDNKFLFKKQDKKLLPIKYKGADITDEMEGKPVRLKMQI